MDRKPAIALKGEKIDRGSALGQRRLLIARGINGGGISQPSTR